MPSLERVRSALPRDALLGALFAIGPMSIALVQGCGGNDAPEDARTDGGSEVDASGDGGPSQTTYRCNETTWRAPAPALGGAIFVDVTSEAGIDPDLTYGFGRVTVVDVDGDGWDDIVGTPAHDGNYDGRRLPFDKLVLRNRGDGTFEDHTMDGGLSAAQVGLMVFADVDNDGDQDMFGGTISGQGLTDRGIWLNERGRFTHAGRSGLELQRIPCGDLTCTPAQIGATFVDLDSDGALDLYVGGWFWSDGSSTRRYTPPPADRLYMGNGDGTFRDTSDRLPDHAHRLSGTSTSAGRAAMGVSAGDFDNDGDMDVFVANYGAGRPALRVSGDLTCSPPRYWDQNLLWRNDSGSLINVAEGVGVHATNRGPSGIAAEERLVMGSECPADVRGTYESPIGGNSFTSQLADFDNDGDLDLIVGSISHPDYLQSDPTTLFVNQGPPDFHFVEEATTRGLQYREDEKQVGFVDVDGDGLLDVVATGFRDPDTNDFRVYLQNEDHVFVRQDADASGIDDRNQESMAWLDYDRDGDLDLYLAEDADGAHLFENQGGDDRQHLVVRLEGASPRDGTGARVTLTTTAGTQMREMTSGNGHYNPQQTRALHFGLGGDRCAEDLRVRWPDGGTTDLGNVSAGFELTVRYDGRVEAHRAR